MSRLVDLTGKVFGQLTVLERVKIEGENESHWLCQCTCGNKKVILAGNLKSGNTTPCGCTAIEKVSNAKLLDITGKKFGRLTALYISKREISKPTLWHCKCDCGQECDVSINNLQSGHTQSCGCLWSDTMFEKMTKDLTGQTFGYLIALEIVGKYASYNLWRCKCKCGNYVNVSSGDLLNGHTTSCGCRRTSYGEEKICEILDAKNIKYLYNNGYFKDLVSEDKLPLRYDFILVNEVNSPYRLIEFDGPQHDKPCNFFGGEQKFFKQKINDKKKNQYALSHNIPLVRILYSKRDSMTLDDLLGDKYLIKGEM